MRYGVHGSALPGLSTSGILSAKAGVQSECTPGELLGRTTPIESVRGKKLSAVPESPVENFERNAARQSGDDLFHFKQRRVNLAHILPRQRMRHPGSGSELLQIIVRRLRVVADGQRVIEENIRRPARNGDQFSSRKRVQRLSWRSLIKKITPDEPDVGNTDLDKIFPSPIMRRADGIQAAVGNAFAQDRNVQHVYSLQRP